MTRNVLITGATSAQCSPQAFKHVVNYTGLLRRALHNMECEVFWSDPSISWTGSDLLHRYDHVFVGLAPVTSLSANRIYGALSVIGEMMARNPTKLTIILDAPEPERIVAGNRAILAHPENLTKTFYTYRKEYELAVRDSRRLLQIISDLHHKPWPNVLIPALPWHDITKAAVAARVPYPARQVHAVNLDSLYMNALASSSGARRERRWVAEGPDTQSVTLPRVMVPRKGAVSYDVAAMDLMCRSLGTLIGSYRGGTWWSPRYVQSLVSHTPVFSDWKETGKLGGEWSMLPMNAETLEQSDWEAIAATQLSSYRAACPRPGQLPGKLTPLVFPKRRAQV